MNKPIYLGTSILDISKTLMYEFCYVIIDKDYNRQLPIGWNDKIIRLFKDELGGRFINESDGLRENTYAYLMDNDSERKKAKGTKKCNKKRTYV